MVDMVTYKNIRIKKPGGGTRLQRVKVLANGKYRFVKNTTRSTPKKRRSTRTTRTRTRTRRTYNPKRKVRKTARKGKLVTKPFMDGLMSGGGKIVMRKVLGSNPIYEAGFDVLLGYIRNNKTLMAQGMVNGATAFLPNLNLLGGQGQEPWMGQ